ncbi:MAG: hypothetical protein CMJ18_10735 [Phycisphaeraceae bacterium]|nr:hypothetical protein [Phycisphaeraceae bacterium]
MKTRRLIWMVLFALVQAACGASRAQMSIEPRDGRFDDLSDLARTLDADAIRAVDAFGQTRLHAAARQGRTDAVSLLLTRGAPTSARDHWGWTPLGAAVQGDQAEAARLLIDAGADLDAKSDDGWTAINLAALLGRSEIVKLLQARGADASAPNRWGNTPLHSAAKKWHKKLFVHLWKSGADPDVADASGMTPRRIVAMRGFEWTKLFQEGTGVLPQRWVFRTDDDEVGEKEKWFEAEVPGAHWRSISTEKLWTHQDYPGIWHGTGWYRIDFTVADCGIDAARLKGASKIVIAFGAIDGHPKVWLNGTLVGSRLDAPLDLFWDKPFSVDVTEIFRADGANRLAVSCTKKSFAAGIHPGVEKIPVRLVVETGRSIIQDTAGLGVE